MEDLSTELELADEDEKIQYVPAPDEFLAARSPQNQIASNRAFYAGTRLATRSSICR
jgi:hypothetical protein